MSGYDPNAADPTRPVGPDPVNTLTLELRRIKAALQALKTYTDGLANTTIPGVYTDMEQFETTVNSALAAAAAAGSAEFIGTELSETLITAPGAGTYTKPVDAAVYRNSDTILVELIGGGGSGAAGWRTDTNTQTVHYGGGPGAYMAFAIRYGDFPATADYVNGAGGAANSKNTNAGVTGNAGGDTYINIGGIEYRAYGGLGGTKNTPTTVEPKIKYAGVDFINSLTARHGVPNSWLPAASNNTAPPGAWNSPGVGGYCNYTGSTYISYPGQVSRNAGSGSAGGSGNPVVGADAESPGGGSGGVMSVSNSATSGKGGDGQIRIRVIRGWFPQALDTV